MRIQNLILGFKGLIILLENDFAWTLAHWASKLLIVLLHAQQLVPVYRTGLFSSPRIRN